MNVSVSSGYVAYIPFETILSSLSCWIIMPLLRYVAFICLNAVQILNIVCHADATFASMKSCVNCLVNRIYNTAHSVKPNSNFHIPNNVQHVFINHLHLKTQQCEHKSEKSIPLFFYQACQCIGYPNTFVLHVPTDVCFSCATDRASRIHVFTFIAHDEKDHFSMHV